MPQTSRPARTWTTRTVMIAVGVLVATLVAATPAQAQNRRVSGTVTYSDGTPAAGVTVSVYADGEGDGRPVATTDFEGKYTGTVATGTYRVGFSIDKPSAEPPAVGQGFWPSGVTIAEGEDLVVSSAPRKGIDGVVKRNGTLKGRLSAAEGAQPGAKGLVTLYRISPDGTVARHDVVRPGLTGLYTLSVPVGRYVVRYEAPGLALQYNGAAPTFDDAQPLTVGETKTVQSNAVLGRGGTLEGQLFAPDGFGTTEVSIEAFQQSPRGWEKLQAASYDQESEWFRISGLNTGPYRICWVSEDDTIGEGRFVDQCIGGTTVSSAQDLSAVAGETRYVPRQVLPTTMSVAGQVTDAAGDPVAGVRVCRTIDISVCHPTFYGFPGDVTDADGRYSFRLPQDATPFVLQFTPPVAQGSRVTFNGGSASAESAPQIPVVVSSTTTQDVQLVADSQAHVRVTGTIKNKTGKGQPDGSVTIRRVADDTSFGRAEAASSGAYSLLLAPGTYELTYAANGFASTTRTVDVVSDVTRSVLLESAPKFVLKGQLLRDGTPLENALVFARDWASDDIVTTRTAADGSYVLRGIPTRNYTVFHVDELTGARYKLGGSSHAMPGTVVPLAPFDASPFVRAVSRPKLTTAPTVGKAVQIIPARWNAGVTLTYAWFAGSTKVATTQAYRPKAADVGKPLRLQVTATRGATVVSTNTPSRLVNG